MLMQENWHTDAMHAEYPVHAHLTNRDTTLNILISIMSYYKTYGKLIRNIMSTPSQSATESVAQVATSVHETSNEALTPFDISVRLAAITDIKDSVIKAGLKWPVLLNNHSIIQICEALSTKNEVTRNETRSLFIKLLESEEADKLVKIVNDGQSLANLESAVGQLPSDNRKAICQKAHELTNERSLDRQKMHFLAQQAEIMHPVNSDLVVRGIFTGVEQAIKNEQPAHEIIREVKKISKRAILELVLEDGRKLLDIAMTSSKKEVIDAVLRQAGYKLDAHLESAFPRLSNNPYHFNTYKALASAQQTSVGSRRAIRRDVETHVSMFSFDIEPDHTGNIEPNKQGVKSTDSISAALGAFHSGDAETEVSEMAPHKTETVSYDTEFDKAIRNLYMAGVKSMEPDLNNQSIPLLIAPYLNNTKTRVQRSDLLTLMNMSEEELSEESKAAFDVADAFQNIRDAVLAGNREVITAVKNTQNENIRHLQQSTGVSDSVAVAVNVLLTVFILPLLAAPLVKSGEWKTMRYTFFSEKTKAEKALDMVEEEAQKNSPPNNG